MKNFFNRRDEEIEEIMEEDDLLTLQRDISNMITSLSNKKHRFAEEINYAYFYILLTDMADMVWRKYGRFQPHHHSEMKRSDNILKEFAELLTANIKKETSVGFYADKLFISPKYLSLIIKEMTGRSAAEWIDECVILEAKNLLRYSGKNIQQVAYELNFTNQSSFGKYFKHLTGMSPSQFMKS